MGPLIDEDQRDWVHNHVEDAVHNGAELRAGGRIPDGPGCFYPPTVLVGPPGDAPVIAQETFGPVAAVRVVGSFAAALEEANRGEYGLAAVVLTPSHANAQRAWRELDVGTVKVNAVFGGAPGGAAEPRRHLRARLRLRARSCSTRSRTRRSCTSRSRRRRRPDASGSPDGAIPNGRARPPARQQCTSDLPAAIPTTDEQPPPQPPRRRRAS